MLKYEIRTGSLGDDTAQLDLSTIFTRDYYADDTKIEAVSEWTNDIVLYDGAGVDVVTTWYKDDGYGGRTPMTFTDNVTVSYCDNISKSFTFIGEKYVELDLTSISIEEENNLLYLHFGFGSWHYFRTWDDYGISINIRFPWNEPNTKMVTFTHCQMVTEMELKWRYDAGMLGIDNFMCSVFRNDKYELVGVVPVGEEDEKYVQAPNNEIPETACFTDELYLKKRISFKNPDCEKWELYEKSCNDGSLMNVTASRLNFRFNDVNITEEYFINPKTSVLVPLTLNTGNNLFEEQNINDKFVNIQISESKNRIVEMEKKIYHPVFKVGDQYKPIHKIKFNLHFREREKDGWIVKSDGYWNGMDTNGLHGDVGGYGGKQYFSYSNKSRQSDLLEYLGFTDSDVKYQKSRLKKSFLRLSFYDSMNRGAQNLLCYSTIFMNGGELYAKMMRGARKDGLYVISDQDGNVKYDNLKVDTEPCFRCIGAVVSDEIIEEYRLSSQIVVSDRLSQACSEGFYLYLWADNDNGAIPSDIYMRVDFNHAGYGRVIPFTMPYLAEHRVYSFEDIEDAWLRGNGWSIKKNEAFSYIHFKYVYDSASKRHVYYIDGDMYGMQSYGDGTPDELELDLYEAKVNFD